MIARLIILLAAVNLFSCDTVEERREPGAVTSATTFANSLETIPGQRGVAGFFNVPEMLCLSVEDSAPASRVAERVELAYTMLEQDLAYTNSVRNGPFGQITYNNDTSNFKFECFVLIRQIPSVSPRNARIVVLEAEHMLAYNYYGPYNRLFTAYADITFQLVNQNLAQ